MLKVFTSIKLVIIQYKRDKICIYKIYLILTLGNFEDVPRQSDMVEVCYSDQVNNLDEEVSSTTSDDFIVVSKVFDLNTPLDEDEIRRRLQPYNGTNGVGPNEAHYGDDLVHSAFSMHVEQLKLEQQQDQEGDASSSDDDEDEKEDDDEDKEEDDENEEEEEETSSERYF